MTWDVTGEIAGIPCGGRPGPGVRSCLLEQWEAAIGFWVGTIRFLFYGDYSSCSTETGLEGRVDKDEGSFEGSSASSHLGFWLVQLGDRSLFTQETQEEGWVVCSFLGFFFVCVFWWGGGRDKLWMEMMSLFWCMLNRKCL